MSVKDFVTFLSTDPQLADVGRTVKTVDLLNLSREVLYPRFKGVEGSTDDCHLTDRLCMPSLVRLGKYAITF